MRLTIPRTGPRFDSRFQQHLLEHEQFGREYIDFHRIDVSTGSGGFCGSQLPLIAVVQSSPASMGHLQGIEIRPRDWALLRGLLESRVMTLTHASDLYFDGKYETAKKRIQKLKAADILRERPRHFSDPSILLLTRRAFELLHDNGHLADYPRIGLSNLERRGRVGDLTLRHELEVIDVKAAMTTAVNRTQRYRIAEFSTWPKLHEFKAFRSDGERVTIRPDGFIRICETEADGAISEHTFFLELDRSTEALDILGEKAHYYLQYYRNGGLAERNGRPREEYKQFPFRVLAICKSEERKRNVAERLLRNDPPIRNQWCMAAFDHAIQDPLSAIWLTAADYALRNTDKNSRPTHHVLFAPKRMADETY